MNAAAGDDGGDAKQLPALCATTRKSFTVKEVCADKAYIGINNLATIKEAESEAFIPFKSNATPTGCRDRGSSVWNKAYHYFHLHQDEFLSRYHQRIHVESTFSMVKAKFGDSVRSKTPVAMRNEVLCKCLCHNICCLISAIYELGLSPEFGGAAAIA